MLSNENAVLATLTTKNWSGYKFDKRISEETQEKHHIEDNAGRFNKKLLKKEALKPMQRTLNDFKTYFRETTLPYTTLLGTRILPTTEFGDFTTVLRQHKDRLAKEMANFLNKWDDHVDEARRMLGTAFKEEDYPDRAKLSTVYFLDVFFQPIPNSADFNAALGNLPIQQLNQQIAEISQEAIIDLFDRIGTVLMALMDTINRPEKRIYHSTISGNIEKLLSHLDKLNFSKDKRLIHLRNEIARDLTSIDADYMRDSKTYRKKLGEKVINIYNQIPEEFRAISNAGVSKV